VIDILVVYLDSIDERLLEGLNQDDGVHGPWLSSQSERGSCTFYQYRRGSSGPRTLAWNGHQRVCCGHCPTGCLGSARKTRLFRTAPLLSAAYRVPMPERERDVAARELANELDEQPKRRGYIEWRVGWKPERGRFETWSSGSSTVIEEPDEAERQRVMDELGAAAQLILARQWKAEERR
jgi:hypothetical protein